MEQKFNMWFRRFEPQLLALWMAKQARGQVEKTAGDLNPTKEVDKMQRLLNHGRDTGNEEMWRAAAQLGEIFRKMANAELEAEEQVGQAWYNLYAARLGLCESFPQLNFLDASDAINVDGAKTFAAYHNAVFENVLICAQEVK